METEKIDKKEDPITEETREIKGKFKGIDISYLVTNFFFYSLNQKKKVTFDVRGNLIEHTIGNKKICILSLENWGDYRKYYMNIISDF